jgi:DNA-directed RNA polymerase specialized sigma24 family protein
MGTEARAPVRTTREGPVAERASPPLEEFEQVYLRNVDVLMGYFARRCRDPHTVADLTSETFVRAVGGFAGFDPRRGSDRAWLFGIAARVFARYCEQSAGGRDAVARLGGHRPLDADEIEELAERIAAEREGAAMRAAARSRAGGDRARRSGRAHPPGGGAGPRRLPGRISEAVVPGEVPAEEGAPKQ